MQTEIKVTKKIITDNKGGEKVIEEYTLDGELDETNSDITFKDIYDKISDFSKNLIFDLDNLSYLNSKSIGYLADIYSKTKENGGKLVLINLQEEIDDTLDLVGVKKFIEVRNSLEEALEIL